MVKIEFDPDKDEINRFKHRLSLSFAAQIFDDFDYVVVESFRPVDGEDRYKAVGLVNGKLYTAIHIWRDDRVRIISVRRSNDGEQAYYDRNTRRPQ
jgi:uncharacterized protein